MYDVSFEEVCISSILWCLIYYYYSERSFLSVDNTPPKSSIVFFIFIVLYCVFSFSSGDFPHYHELYEEIYKGRPQYSLEDLYFYLIKNLPYNYYLWRLVVWGSSSFILLLLFKRLDGPRNLTFLLFILILLPYYSAVRNTLGFMVLYYGLTFFIKPLPHRNVSYFFATFLLLCSIYCHKSMPMYIMLSLFAFIPLSRGMYRIILFSFPFLYGAFSMISKYLLSLEIGGNLGGTGELYLTGENFSVTNLNGYISLCINRIPLLFLIYHVIKRVLNGEITNYIVVFFSRYSFWLMYISFLFFNQPTSSFLSPRFWDASLYPLTFALPLAIYNDCSKNIYLAKKAVIFSGFYSVLYFLYIAY